METNAFVVNVSQCQVTDVRCIPLPVDAFSCLPRRIKRVEMKPPGCDDESKNEPNDKSTPDQAVSQSTLAEVEFAAAEPDTAADVQTKSDEQIQDADEKPSAAADATVSATACDQNPESNGTHPTTTASDETKLDLDTKINQKSEQPDAKIVAKVITSKLDSETSDEKKQSECDSDKTPCLDLNDRNYHLMTEKQRAKLIEDLTDAAKEIE